MRESASDFRGTLQELIEASPEPMDHPSPDQWIAYQRGELPAEEEARLQEHLARCRDCFNLAEGAAAFASPDQGPGTGQDADTSALWRQLRPQLDLPPPSNVRGIRDISSGPRRLLSSGARAPYALAALFFVALVGLSAWSLRQHSALEALRAPRPNAPIFDVSSGERDPSKGEMTVPAGPRMFVFHPAEELPVYRLVIRNAATGGELSSSELRLDRDLALTLYLPEGLPPGHYRLELADGGGGKVLETYLLRVTEPGRGE
jgi:hypothetical protein